MFATWCRKQAKKFVTLESKIILTIFHKSDRILLPSLQGAADFATVEIASTPCLLWICVTTVAVIRSCKLKWRISIGTTTTGSPNNSKPDHDRSMSGLKWIKRCNAIVLWQRCTYNCPFDFNFFQSFCLLWFQIYAVSYTHLTLPTKLEV